MWFEKWLVASIWKCTKPATVHIATDCHSALPAVSEVTWQLVAMASVSQSDDSISIQLGTTTAQSN